MKRAAHTNPKLSTLARILDVPKCMAVGVLESIWHFTATQAPRGDIGKWSDEDIAAAIDWPGEPEQLIEALVEARWIDRSDQHRLLVHDWAHHADQTTRRYEVVKQEGFASDPPASASEQLASAEQPEPEPEPEPEPGPDQQRVRRQKRAAKNGSWPMSLEGLVRARDDDAFLGELLELIPVEARPNRGPPFALVDVFAWLCATLPRMRQYGRKDLKRTARNWIQRANSSEIINAAERLEAGEFEEFRNAESG